MSRGHLPAQPSTDSIYQTMGPMSNKGLKNPTGQNNCFLNSSIQILWHLDVFRRSFRHVHVESHRKECHRGKSCVVCSLEIIFTQYQHSEATALPPDSMRRALAQTYENESRFQLGVMDDGAECYEHILSCIHGHVNPSDEDPCTTPYCITHRKFAATIEEKFDCPHCGSTTEPFVYAQIINYVSVLALIGQPNERRISFGANLYKSGSTGQYQVCQNISCRQLVGIQKTALTHPDILSIGLIWDTDSASVEHVSQVLSMIDTRIRLSEVFDRPSSQDDDYVLVALMAYYGMHYTTYSFHTKQEAWIYFDDSHFRKVGPSWDLVVRECIRGRYQPLLLVYARQSATAIPRIHNDDVTPATTIPSAPTGDLIVFGPGEQDVLASADVTVASAQEKERAGDFEGALDSYAQAFCQYRKSIASACRPGDERGRADLENKRDLCRVRSRSLARKLGYRRQKTIDESRRATAKEAGLPTTTAKLVSSSTKPLCSMCATNTLYLKDGLCVLCRMKRMKTQ